MDVRQIVARMEENAQVILHLAAGVSQEQARWRPTPDDWSLLEVINHLYDEEREDFRARVDCMLHRPDEEFTPIHPGAWVTERRYNERDLAESLSFLWALLASAAAGIVAYGAVFLLVAIQSMSSGDDSDGKAAGSSTSAAASATSSTTTANT